MNDATNSTSDRGTIASSKTGRGQKQAFVSCSKAAAQPHRVIGSVEVYIFGILSMVDFNPPSLF